MSKRKDIIGQNFGEWTVLSYVRTDGKIAIYSCECTCGTVQEVRGYNLRAGRSRSCVACGRKRTLASLKGKDKSKYEPAEKTKRRFMKEYKYRISKKGLSFDLTFEQFDTLTGLSCYYCGIVPSTRINRTNESGTLQIRQSRYDAGWTDVNGLDRLDPKIGYRITNVVPCCSTCNKAKLAMSVNEFKKWIQRVYKHFAADIKSPD